VKGDEGVTGWEVSSTLPNVKAGLGWPNPEPDELNVNPVGCFGFSSNLLTKGLESPEAFPKLNDELMFPLLWAKFNTRPENIESPFGRGVVPSSTTLVGLSSILTSSSSLGGVTGRGKLPKSDLCASVVLELAPNVKIPGLDVPCADSPNCGAAGFSGDVEGAPNLKANENAGFGSFGASLCTTTGILADSPWDGVEVDCSRVNSFGLSVGLVAPNPGNGVRDESPNEKIDGIDPFCSGVVVAGFSPTVEVTEGRGVVKTSVESAAELRYNESPNKPDDG